MILGLAGYARTGKDTVGTILCAHGFERAAFADPLRALALALDPMVDHDHSLAAVVRDHGWEGAKDRWLETRGILQRLGQGVRDILGENTWVHALLDRLDPSRDWVVTDVRYPNEAQAIVSRGGRIVRVERPGIGPANAHASETAMDDWPYDAIIVNDGTLDELRARVTTII